MTYPASAVDEELEKAIYWYNEAANHGYGLEISCGDIVVNNRPSPVTAKQKIIWDSFFTLGKPVHSVTGSID